MKNPENRSDLKDRNANVLSLWIDSYDEIFSGFDPRPFSERAISDDFIVQMRRMSRETRGKIAVLKLLLPDGTQNEDSERIIKKRLVTYFNDISQRLRLELKSAKARGYSFTVSGVMLMIVASYISFLKLPAFSFNLIRVLFEPGGWFLFWTGLEILVSNIGNQKKERQFYNRVESVHIEFGTYK